MRVGQRATLTVDVSGAPTGAKIDGWVDFDRDGSFGGALEQVFDRTSVVNGRQSMSFLVPSWAATGMTAARFRISSAGDLGVFGSANDGEVEDYQFEISPPVPNNSFIGPSTIDVGAKSSIFESDLDRDGDRDLISGNHWYRNNGPGTFTELTLPSVAGFPIDVDGDGDTDVTRWAGQSLPTGWLENNGAQVFSSQMGATQFPADVDADGDVDFLGWRLANDLVDFDLFRFELLWIENNGFEEFTTHVFYSPSQVFDTTNENITVGDMHAGDANGDGVLDLFASWTVAGLSSSEDNLAWFENDGQQNFNLGASLATVANGSAASVLPKFVLADLNGDSNLDVAASFNSAGIRSYTNDGAGNFSPAVLNAAPGRSIFNADLDGDGDQDLLVATTAEAIWYRNDATSGFTEVANAFPSSIGANDVLASDINGDGALDVIVATTSELLAYVADPGTSVVDRHIFYNASPYDGNNAGATADDDRAIATDKSALLPGQTASFENYTSYSRGINGIMIDVAGLSDPNGINSGDFEFRVGNTSNLASWVPAPAPASIAVRALGGGVHRITVTWASGAIDSIEDEWLEVRLLANDDTGLTTDERHYWGNLVGETGNVATNAVTAFDDLQLAFGRLFREVGIESQFDINRNKTVEFQDLQAMFSHVFESLELITIPGAAVASVASTASTDEIMADFGRLESRRGRRSAFI